MHGSLEDGNVAEEASNIFEDTDGDGRGVIAVWLNEVDQVGFPCEFLRSAVIDEEETCSFSNLENKGTLNKVDESDGACDSHRENEDKDNGDDNNEDEGREENKGKGEGDDDGEDEGEGENEWIISYHAQG